MKNLFEEICAYVSELIKNSQRFSQPFRNRYEHTLRVLKWAERIQKIEGGDLEELTIAVLFHDCGFDEKVPHAEVSALHAEKFLRDKGFEEEKLNKIVNIVRNHSSKELPAESLSIEEKIMIDADMMDELGATTVVWDSMSIALKDSPSYLKVYEQNKHYLDQIKAFSVKLKTETGKKLYEERIKFIENFIRNFEYEFGITEEI
jgi:uncharacterized protein